MKVVGKARWAAVAVLAVAGGLGLLVASGEHTREQSVVARPGFSLGAVLGTAGAGFERALEARALHFPEDAGPHPRFRSEWWYYTGNLDAPDGRGFGFQLVFFRFALAHADRDRASAWAARDVYMAHFALTDVGGGQFHAAERLARGALGLAGARARPYRVWVEDWSAEAISATRAVPGTDPEDALYPLRLRAEAGSFGIDLEVEAGKSRVLHGEAGLSRKGSEPGNASYYYSRTRMPIAGRVRVDGAQVQVRGLGWLDREWSTSALDDGQEGWDWFALQLSDGRELMYYRLRRRGGATDPWSAGTLVDPDGRGRHLGADEVAITALEQWTSPDGAARYPARWRLEVPAEALSVEIVPRLAGQEIRESMRYWEGAVQVHGTARGRAVSGRGYVELTGYARTPD